MHSRLQIPGLLITLLCGACQSYRAITPVAFEQPVDTHDHAIDQQEKQTWTFGHLKVNNTFDCARLNALKQENDSTWIATILPENYPINPSPWYAFEIETDSAGTYYFILDYGAEMHRYAPKRVVRGQVHAVDSADVIPLSESQTAVRLRLDETPMILAAQPIVSSEDVHAWVQDYAAQWSLKYRTYGRSRDGRPLKYLDIHRGSARKPLIVLLCRQHPPEVTGWFALQAFLQELMEHYALRDTFFDRYRVLVYPVLNPDGVDRGFWRHNTGGVDLNRDWSTYQQPEIAQTVAHVVRMTHGQPVLLALDFHSTYQDIFYTNDESARPSNLPGFKDAWLTGLRTRHPEFIFEERNSMPQTPVSKNWFYRYFNATAITYEIGDDTPESMIELKGRASAAMMMELLTQF